VVTLKMVPKVDMSSGVRGRRKAVQGSDGEHKPRVPRDLLWLSPARSDNTPPPSCMPRYYYYFIFASQHDPLASLSDA
jgi:hypothetical protein